MVGRAWFVSKGDEGPLGPAVTLGRNSYNDIVIPDTTISNRHCQFRCEPGRVLISDLGSLNGTSVDGHRLEPGERYALKSRMKLALGRLEFEFLTAQSFLHLISELAGLSRRRHSNP